MTGLALRISERVYRALLVTYPEGFRKAYGPQMTQVFRDACREAAERAGLMGLMALWAHTMLDLLSTALTERRRANIATGDRIERLRHALTRRKREPSRTRLWATVVIFIALLRLVWLYFDDDIMPRLDEDLSMILRTWGRSASHWGNSRTPGGEPSRLSCGQCPSSCSSL